MQCNANPFGGRIHLRQEAIDGMSPQGVLLSPKKTREAKPLKVIKLFVDATDTNGRHYREKALQYSAVGAEHAKRKVRGIK